MFCTAFLSRTRPVRLNGDLTQIHWAAKLGRSLSRAIEGHHPALLYFDFQVGPRMEPPSEQSMKAGNECKTKTTRTLFKKNKWPRCVRRIRRIVFACRKQPGKWRRTVLHVLTCATIEKGKANTIVLSGKRDM